MTIDSTAKALDAGMRVRDEQLRALAERWQQVANMNAHLAERRLEYAATASQEGRMDEFNRLSEYAREAVGARDARRGCITELLAVIEG